MKKKILFSLLILKICLFTAVNVSAQYKSYKISPKGDTINIVNANGKKQGKWVNRIEELRGEPGYEEEGTYNKDGTKDGPWRLYTLEGDLLGIENYKNGGKDGVQQYFTYLGDLVREESWRGYDPEHPYDTIAIYGTGSNEIVEFKIVKAEQYSVKHGTWKYYQPGTGILAKQEEWDRNVIAKPKNSSDAAVAAAPVKKKEIEKTPEMLEWEKKNKGKKNAIRDGRTGL
ncbi:MAG: hypothetical protein EOP53_18585 [Sphingobacteriales bacterium]|nr:MAG: hypothetical protein EOP53_18585 [Sphingobacteriales bacterium]